MIFFSSFLFSKVYYAKVEPYEVRNISSNVIGLVMDIDEDMIGRKLTSKPFIKIDSELDNRELKFISKKLVYLKNIVITNKKVLDNLNALLKKKKLNYEKIKLLSVKSIVEKDREFYDLVNSENQSLSTVKEIDNLNIQITDLLLRKEQLKRSIFDKYIRAKDFTLYSILVRPGQVVNVATPLAQVADISRAKLTIFLDAVDIVNIKSKSIYIDGEASLYEVTRILNITDTKNISKYKAEIIIKAPKVFSKLVQIELK